MVGSDHVRRLAGDGVAVKHNLPLTCLQEFFEYALRKYYEEECKAGI
jgi:hypothetical protein